MFWKRRESNPGQLGEKRECYLCAVRTPLELKLYQERRNPLVDLAGDETRRGTDQLQVLPLHLAPVKKKAIGLYKLRISKPAV